jgi:DAK2 domain fusion protein YloV
MDNFETETTSRESIVENLSRKNFEIKRALENVLKYFWKYKEYVNRLNVFPVPDGNTGLNIALTIQGALANTTNTNLDSLLPGEYLKMFSENMLLNSRGCSGVILSLFVQGFTEITANNDFSKENVLKALENGTKRAYEGTENPKEGTMLTMMRELKEKYSQIMVLKDNPMEIVIDCIPYLREVLDKTPDMLPVLKQAGVVDSGATGFIILLEGLEKEYTTRRELKALPVSSILNINNTIKKLVIKNSSRRKESKTLTLIQHLGLNKTENYKLFHIVHNAQIYLKNHSHNHISTEKSLINDINDIESSWNPEIKFRYCTELAIKRENHMPIEELKQEIKGMGDSFIFLENGDTCKIHIHTNKPDTVIKEASQYGEVIFTKVDDMKKQHQNLISEDTIEYEKEQSIFCIVSGEGFKNILENLGADFVYNYGSKKPSVNQLVGLMNNLKAKNIIAAPDDGDILMSLKYAASLCKANVLVVESKNVISIISMLMGRTNELNANNFSFTERLHNIKYCMISKASRNTTLDGVDIKKNDFFTIHDGKVILAGKNLLEVAKKSINKLLKDESLITFYTGQPAKKYNKIIPELKATFSNLEFEEYYGGQLQYFYYITFE